jgi:4-amino-4-deoxy-L-arabinose transferase-like glycosyltransferase
MFRKIRLNQELVLLLIILGIGAFLRLYRIADYMTFLGDEGRDVLVVKRMIVDHKFRLIGPVTSIGNMYLGPLFYYLITPSMLVSGFSPVGPAVMVAVLGILTIALVWQLAREWFGSKAALVAAFLYSISPVVVEYSRSSWNPNVMPFFALILVYGIWQTWQKQKFIWLVFEAVALSFAVQSHYWALLLMLLGGMFWLVAMINLFRTKTKIKVFLLFSLVSAIVFLLLTIFPLFLFDLRHGFINSKAFVSFFSNSHGVIDLKIGEVLFRLVVLTEQIFTRLVVGKDKMTGIGLLLGVMSCLLLKFRKNNQEQLPLILLGVWLIFGLFGLATYNQAIYDHYFGFLFPAPFVLTGWAWSKIWSDGGWKKMLAIVFLGWFVLLAAKGSFLRRLPNKQLERTEKVVDFVLAHSNGESFNFALLAEENYDDAYVYFMETKESALLKIDPSRAKETIARQLFVVCEEVFCQPINNPKAEIAMFGWAKVDRRWEVLGLEIYRLVHNVYE